MQISDELNIDLDNTNIIEQCLYINNNVLSLVEKCAESVLNSFKNVPEIFHFGSAKQYISLTLQNVT